MSEQMTTIQIPGKEKAVKAPEVISAPDAVVASNSLLAFPIRHHYECYANCKLCLDDHMRLANFLYEVGGIPRSRVDALGDYRRWLNRHKIYAEGPDGWGTRNAFDAANIKAYLREEWDCAAFDDANNPITINRKGQ